jgi:anaerobic selenocysteine-containing dehydrogenase
MDPETLRFSKFVVLWGANVLSTNPHLWRSILDARKNGALVVAIDPIRTRTAAQSDWHIALVIHPDDAAPRCIASGDEVRVANARGTFFAVADVSDRVRSGVVASTKGRWPGDSKQGATINATVDERDSDMGGGAVYRQPRSRRQVGLIGCAPSSRTCGRRRGRPAGQGDCQEESTCPAGLLRGV